MALPVILHGTKAINLSNTYLANLQKKIENKAFHYIVNARRKTAISALRGELHELQSTRDMK